MLRIRPTPAPRTEVHVRTRRPPLQYLELLSTSEEQFRNTVEEIETDPLFRELQARGVVKRRGGRGRMPRAAYEERLDRDVAAFIRRYGLDAHPGSLERLQHALQKEGVAAVARRMGASPAEVQRVARFLTERSREEGGTRARAASGEAAATDIADYVAGPTALDPSAAIAVVRDFVHRFSLTQQQLVGDFLHGEAEPLELARRYRTTEQVIRRVMEAVTFVLTADIVAESARAPRAARPHRAEYERPIVGRVHLLDGEPHLHFGEETGYGLRYVIDPAGLSSVEAPRERQSAEALLGVLRHVNQRRSLQCRVCAAVLEVQRRYFASGDELDLVPLSQADLARQLKEHQSTVSRAVRGRYLETPWGTEELQHFCQRKREVVRRVAAAFPHLGDHQLQQVLRDRYRCRIARRTVAYHRGGEGPAAATGDRNDGEEARGRRPSP